MGSKRIHAYATAALLAMSLASAALADEIRVLNWKGYGSDESWALKEFKDKTGHAVIHDYYNSEEEMLTKLRTNPGLYDVVMINATYIGRAREAGFIAPIDTTKIAHYKDLTPALVSNPELASEGKVFGVPWVWGVTSFAVNRNAVKPIPDSLSVFWNPAYKGKIGWRDEALLSVYIGALATGQKISDVKDLGAVKAKLEELMPQVKTFWSSENDWNQFFAAGDFQIGTYWSGAAGRSANKGLPVTYVVPKEGAVGWLDIMTVSKTSKHRDAALQFINYMVDPGFYLQWAKTGAPVSANQIAVAQLPEGNFNRVALGDKAIIDRIQFMTPLSDSKRKEYLALWQEIKARASR